MSLAGNLPLLVAKMNAVQLHIKTCCLVAVVQDPALQVCTRTVPEIHAGVLLNPHVTRFRVPETQRWKDKGVGGRPLPPLPCHPFLKSPNLGSLPSLALPAAASIAAAEKQAYLRGQFNNPSRSCAHERVNCCSQVSCNNCKCGIQQAKERKRGLQLTLRCGSSFSELQCCKHQEEQTYTAQKEGRTPGPFRGT